MKCILTHPGSAHKDDFLACCLLVARYVVPIERREPTPADLADPRIAVVDVGGSADASLANFDHHQFPADHPPICALSLVLQDLGIYEDARSFCEWLEPTEWFDTRGPFATAEWLGVERGVMARLVSPVDITLLRRFAQRRELGPGDAIWEVMRMIGEDLMMFLRTLRERIDSIGRHAQFLTLGEGDDAVRILFMPRTDPMPDDPSQACHASLNRSEQRSMASSIPTVAEPDSASPAMRTALASTSPASPRNLMSTSPMPAASSPKPRRQNYLACISL